MENPDTKRGINSDPLWNTTASKSCNPDEQFQFGANNALWSEVYRYDTGGHAMFNFFHSCNYYMATILS